MDWVTSMRDHMCAEIYSAFMASRINKKLVAAFARALREIRAEQGLTQEQVAHAAGVHRTYIAFLEGGKKQPSIDAVFKIAEGLGVTPSDFVAKVDSFY